MGKGNYKSHVGPPTRYDQLAALQFRVLTSMGLRGHHKVLDIGCGSLRLGRLLIPFLEPGHYFGIEPARWAVAHGFLNELGCDIIQVKKPRFSDEREFDLSVFGPELKFDYLIAQSIFSHTPLGQMVRCIRSASEVMHGSSVFVFNYRVEREDYSGNEWVYPKTVGFTRQTVRGLVEVCGMSYEQVFVSEIYWDAAWVRCEKT